MRTTRRLVVATLIAVAVVLPLFDRPGHAGLLDGKVDIVTGSARGIG